MRSTLRSRPRVSFAIVLAAASVALFAGRPLRAQTGFVKGVYKDEAGTHRYMVYVPKSYTPRRKWPVVLFLHGAGERGRDGIRQTVVGLGPMIRRHPERFPFLVVFPQAEDLRSRVLRGWYANTADGERALKILAQVERQYSVDPKRRILSGWSMGGAGAWSLAAEDPKRWAGVVSVSGGGNPALAKKLKDVPAWAFHGKLDAVVPADSTRKMVQAVRKAGGRAAFTLVENVGHSAWKFAFDDPALLKWMQDPSKPIDAPARATATTAEKNIATDEKLVPFVPAVEVSRGLTVRLGNDALRALSYSLPQLVPRNMLTGRIADIYDSTVASGRTFNVQFSGIGYSAQLKRAIVQGAGKDRLRVQLGLQNVTLSIGATYVTGSGRSATAGAIYVVIGHRRPVWLTIDVRPSVQKGKPKLKTLARYFNIPDDNWYVTQPAGVSTSGLGMTSERVSSGLVSGLYGSKGRIEREVLAVVPKIVKELEKKLEVPDASGFLDKVWPMPVYAPRVRLHPESIHTDANGVTVSVGLVAAAIDPSRAPARPRKVVETNELPKSLSSGKSLQVGLASNLLAALTQLMIDGGVAHIDVLDIPQPEFARLADRTTMEQIIPELKRVAPNAPLRTEIALQKPIAFSTSNGGKGIGPATALKFEGGTLIVSVGEEGAAGAARGHWKPFAEMSLQLTQPLKLSVRKDGFTGRSVDIDLSSPAELTVTAKPGGPKVDTERVREIFLKGWKGWAQKGIVEGAAVPDLELGGTVLRLSSIGTSPSELTATFAPPGIKITNGSDKTLTYEVKGPTSGWGGPYTLKPGEFHEFPVPYSMIYRRRAGNRYVMYTLPAGSHSEFRSPASGGEPYLFKAK